MLEVKLIDREFHVGLACIKWRWRGKEGYDAINKTAAKYGEQPEPMAAAIKPEIAGSLERLVTAAVSAYNSFIDRTSISRNPGLELLLYLLGERNISRVIGKYDPEDKAIIIVVSRRHNIARALLEDIVNAMGISKCCFTPREAAILLEKEGKIRLAEGYSEDYLKRLLETYTAVFAGLKPKE